MALYVKQDFSPPVLSRRWIAMKLRPNMILYSRQHIISILESGLLFREDSVEVEQECPLAEDIWKRAGGGRGGWLTQGERVACVCAVVGCVVAFPPKSLQRSSLINVAAYLALPVAIRACHRLACRGSLCDLLAVMRDYLALARRAAACLRECAALRAELGSVSSAIESTHTMLCRQQSSLAILMSRASSALLGNAPWLRGDVAWAAVTRDNTDNLMKIHHAFLVVQSTLLKHIAMAHYMPSPQAQKTYKNHNERIYWIHSVLITHLNEDFKQSFESLERMYRLLKNYGNNDVIINKKMCSAVKDSWMYSDVHSGVARANLELKLALNKCNNLDTFLDSCALNKQEIDLEILNKDIDDLIENITKSLTTAQNSQIRLKKLQNKFGVADNETQHEELIADDRDILQIEDKEPETKDEVFYFVRTDDNDIPVQPIADISTGPGRKEKEATKVVLTELKRKLVKREDVMRERERQALAKTMPELKDNVPEFPRQINVVNANRKGFISKIPKKTPKRRRLRHYKIKSRKTKNCFKKYELKNDKYSNESDIQNVVYKANSNLSLKIKLLTFCKESRNLIITKWFKQAVGTKKELDSSGLSEGLSDVEVATINRSVNQAVNDNHEETKNGDARNFKFSKKDLELSPSSSESDFEFYEKQVALLKDARRHKTAKKKNYPEKRAFHTTDHTVDESLRPIEYSFGAGMAMASVLQINSAARLPNMAGEEVFTGDGEVSQDSGNDEDA